MIRLGVVGFGLRSEWLVKDAFRKVGHDFRVVGIVDPDEKRARERLEPCDQKDVVFYSDLGQMVASAKLDALLIGTRCNLHSPYAIAAAEYDVPLYLEKPVATSMEQAVALERAFEKAKCQVMVSFPLRVSPLCELARQHIEDGAVGDCEHIAAVNYVTYGNHYFEQGYRDYEITQGLFLQKATHDFDYMSYLMGSNIVRVAAMTTCGRVYGGDKPSQLVCSKCDEAESCMESPANRARLGLPVAPWEEEIPDHLCAFSVDCGSRETGMNEDSSSALLEFPDGRHGVYTQVFFSRRDAHARGAIVSGYKGTLSFDWYENKLKCVRHHQPFTAVEKADDKLSHFGGDLELARDFVGMIKKQAKPRATIWKGIQSVYACLAAKESAQTGKFVKVRQVGQ